MKLYTEEQVREVYVEGWSEGQNHTHNVEKMDKFINSLTPIELPSDEEIEEEVIKHFPIPLNKNGEPMTQLVGHNPHGFNKFKKAFIKGYKSALEHIRNQNK